MTRSLRITAFVASLLALPAIAWATAYGHAIWSKLDIEASTHLGTVRVQATTSGKREDMKLAQVRVDLDGRRVPWPRNVDIHVREPRLHELQVVHTASVTCIGDCPDISAWPVTLSLPFGEMVGHHADVDDDDRRSDVCRYSRLHIEFTADGVDRIETWTCNPDTGDFDIRALFPAADEANTRQ